MPAVSQQQQKLFGLALAVKRGEVARSEASDEVLNIVDSMSEKDIEDFASTSHEGLPKQVEARLRETLRELMRDNVLSEADPCWKGYQQIGMKMKNGKEVPNCVPESVNEGKKVFKVNPQIGKAKYSISSHDGVKKHKDGSDFFDIETFKNKVDLEKAIKKYTSQGFQMESVNEVASRTAMEIGGLTGMNKDAIQKFVDDNNLDIEKVFQFVKKGKLSDRMDMVSAIAGKPGNPIQKKMIKMFGESVVNEDANMNKKVKALLDKHLKDLRKGGANHQWAVMHILMGALGDANFHSEAKQVSKLFPKAKYEGDPMAEKDLEEMYHYDLGSDVAQICKWDGKDIVMAIGFYVSMTIGRPVGEKVEKLVESLNEEKYPIAVEKFNKELIKHPMVKKAAQFYKKTPAEIVKAVQQRLYSKGDKSGNTKEVYIDFKDTTSGITIKHKMKFNESAGCGCGCGCGGSKMNEALKADPRKVYGGTGAKEGMVLVKQAGFIKVLELSKKNPSNVFLVSDDNYTNFGPFYVKNGKVAKYTVANPNYDLEKNKVRTVKVPNDVILKFKVVE